MQRKSSPPKAASQRFRPSITWTSAVSWLFLLILWIVPAHADSSNEEPFGISLAKFGTGIITAYALHEVGHATAGYLTGTDIDWGLGTYNQPLGFKEDADCDTDGMIVHASGLFTQVGVSEIILQSESIDNNSNLVRGMMFWNIVNPIVYALDYWFIRRTNQESDTTYQGDIEGFENYTNDTSANVFAAGMLSIAAIQGYRYIKTQTWAPGWMQRDDVRLNLQTSGRKAMALMVEIDF
jgi:hypothetical protein